jgi:hypothetical protein
LSAAQAPVSGKPTGVEQTRDHVMGLIEQYDIVLNWVTRTSKARAGFEIWEIWIPFPTRQHSMRLDTFAAVIGPAV